MRFDRGQVGREVRIGTGQLDEVAGGPEVRAGRRRRVGGNSSTEDGHCDGNRDERQDQHLLAPLAAEQSPPPAHHRTPSRHTTVVARVARRSPCRWGGLQPSAWSRGLRRTSHVAPPGRLVDISRLNRGSSRRSACQEADARHVAPLVEPAGVPREPRERPRSDAGQPPQVGQTACQLEERQQHSDGKDQPDGYPHHGPYPRGVLLTFAKEQEPTQTEAEQEDEQGHEHWGVASPVGSTTTSSMGAALMAECSPEAATRRSAVAPSGRRCTRPEGTRPCQPKRPTGRRE